jgi:hypothetical protein
MTFMRLSFIPEKKKIPALSLANRTFLGAVPSELKDLTVIEEAMIARCRSKCWILQLIYGYILIVIRFWSVTETNFNLRLRMKMLFFKVCTQRGIKGHIIIHPQQPSKVADVVVEPRGRVGERYRLCCVAANADKGLDTRATTSRAYIPNSLPQCPPAVH